MTKMTAHHRRWLAITAIILALGFLITGTLGPAHRSPYYWLIVPPPAIVALALGWKAYVTPERSTRLAAAAIALLLIVLLFSHLLPRSAA